MRYLLIAAFITLLHLPAMVSACEPPAGFAPPPPLPLNQQIRWAHHQASRIVEGTVFAMPNRANTNMMYIVVDQYFKGSGTSVLFVANDANPCSGPTLWHQDHAVFFLRGQSLLNRFEANEQVATSIQNRTGLEPYVIPHSDPRPLVILFGLALLFPAVGLHALCYGFNRYR